MKLTPLGKLIIAVAFLVAAFFAVQRFAPDLLSKIIPQKKTRSSVQVQGVNLPGAASSASSSLAGGAVRLPGTGVGCANLPEVRFYHWAWNAQMGLMLATGGQQATTGSLMCENGVNLKFTREDDAGKMQEALIAFATELSRGNPNPSSGAHFVAIMGDGAGAFLAGLNEQLARIGPDYTAKVVGSAGYSRGEDKFMGPPEWKQNPAASRGGVVSGYLRDGDWNIAQKWLGDNGLCNNPDETTWDPNCLNWVAANDYIDAAEKYVVNYCEDRPVAVNGQRTGERRRVCVNGVVTWTPGDVTVAQKRGGLVSIVSTKEYSSQMPNTIIGIDRWMKSNRRTVEGMLGAIFTGGDMIKASPEALRYAAGISAQVYDEAGADAAYWEKYYRGVVERDRQGLAVELGGSSVNNLADNLLLYGMVPGSSNLFAATYKVFGDIVVQQYPDLVPSYPSVDRILDTSYVQALASRTSTATAVARAQPTFEGSAPVRQVVSRRSWQITFDSGRATFTASAQRDLDQLLRDLLVASGTVVEVHGHTDAQGNPDSNLALSEARAFAVKQWLEQRAPVNFPAGRIRVFSHGQQNPVAPNSTAEGRAQNRRVEIVLGTTGG
ncbi:MAG TPA: OmpA family protein [Thermoanaerobaculia bacterium]|nr:OmpA family protein [Thermoanaerobaculia bacterium]